MSDPSPETTADPTAGAVATAQVTPDSPAEPAASADTAAATEATEATGNTEAPRRTLRNMSEIRTFFRTNETPIFFIGPTAFNLLGVDRWVRNFSFISYLDSWDGYQPRVFTPPLIDHEEFTSGEDVNNYLLRHPAVRAHIEADPVPGGGKPKVAMVFFDEETERICAEQGYELILPSFELRNHLDSKITTTRLGNEAGAPSVPNILTTVQSYEDLLAQADDAGLGDDLVLQSAYGDSGKTTFFVASREDWNKCSADIVDEKVKVMKRIRSWGSRPSTRPNRQCFLDATLGVMVSLTT